MIMRAPVAGSSLLASVVAAGLACSRAAPTPEAVVLTADEQKAGWRLLFDGQTTAGWRGFKRPDLPAGWQVIDGALTRVAEAGDIVTDDEFQDFELALEWQVEPGGNSGIFYRVSEAPQLEAVWESGPEMQVLDDKGHKDGQRPETSAGACYDMYPAPRGISRPGGEWNQVRLLVRGRHVEHWLNGSKVVEYELDSPDWERRLQRSKFAKLPRYGREPAGHIALQDHGDRVAYRNIRIRTLSPSVTR
jgi:hypothetical protein